MLWEVSSGHPPAAGFPALLVVIGAAGASWPSPPRCLTAKMGTSIDIVNDQRLRDIQREYLEFLEDEVRA